MAKPGKDTIYIDVEDEITAVIEKVVNAKNKVVAIVLPKRSTVFQSVVNLKLLKKAAISSKKNIVLITSDASILAIAGTVGVHVAKTPTSKPVIPAAIATKAVTETVHVDDADESSDNLKKAAVVTGAGLATAKAVGSTNDEEAIELDNTTPDDKKTDNADKTSTKKKKKIAKIPDFSSFTMKMWLGFGLIVILAVMWVFGFVIMPNATVTVNTDVSTTSINTTVTAQVGESELILDENIIPATRVQVEKIDSTTVPATGEKNIGNKATGEITLTNCIKDDEKKVIPAGTSFSKNNLRFVTSEQIILGPAVYVGSNCISADFPGLGAQGTVGAVADSPGTEYNVSEGSFVSSISGIQAYGSDMTGGSSEVVKVISQEDIDKATQELAGASKNVALSELQQQLRDENNRPIEVTLIESKPEVVASPAVGAEADETKVTMTVNYSLLGVKDEDLNQILDKEVKDNLGDTPVNIRENGLEGVKFTLSESSDEANTVLTMETVATIGPDIDEVEIKESIIGKKRGDIEKQIESIDGVRSVSVEYSPFWITTTPKSAKKINIIFVESDGN